MDVLPPFLPLLFPLHAAGPLPFLLPLLHHATAEERRVGSRVAPRATALLYVEQPPSPPPVPPATASSRYSLLFFLFSSPLPRASNEPTFRETPNSSQPLVTERGRIPILDRVSLSILALPPNLLHLLIDFTINKLEASLPLRRRVAISIKRKS